MDVAEEKQNSLSSQLSWLFYSTVPSKLPYVFVFQNKFFLAGGKLFFLACEISWQLALSDIPASNTQNLPGSPSTRKLGIFKNMAPSDEIRKMDCHHDFYVKI